MSPSTDTERRGIIAWFAANPVAANLMMFVVIAFGVASAVSIRKQTTPDFELNGIQVRVDYPGAAPQEVEEGIAIKIEEAVQDIREIDKLTSVSREGSATVTAEVAADVDLDRVLSDMKTRVDAISTLPELAEKPVISKQEFDIPVIMVSVYGNLDAFARKMIAQQIRDELILLPDVNDVEILGDRPFEIAIEVSEFQLQKFGLTMSEVADAIRAFSLDLPGGTLKTSGGDILLRTEGQVYTGDEFAALTLRNYPDGTRLTLADVARIDDGFVETSGYGRFNGRETAILRVVASGQQNELATAAAVKAYAADKRAELPDGVMMDIWVDRAHYLQGRLDMMLDNMFQGALLVFLILSLFLRLKVALWVIVGLPVAFFGALWLMPLGPWPVTINVISLFGFILVLGIVVDDAIIVGESIYTKIRADGHTLDNVIAGTHRVAVPATFGVLTTIAAFTPMLFVGGFAGPFFEAMSVVVILCLVFSLVESKLILPAHLAHARIPPVDEQIVFASYEGLNPLQRVGRFFLRIQRRFQHGLQRLIHDGYAPLLDKSLRSPGVTISLFVGVLIVTFGVLGSGLVRVVLFPESPSDFLQANITMYSGTPTQERDAVLNRLEDTLLELNRDYVAEHPGVEDPVNHVAVFTNGDISGTVLVEMPMTEDRPLNGEDITAMWRERVGELPGVRELEFTDADRFGGGPPLSFALSGTNYEALEAAGKELENKLYEFDGVFDIRNSMTSGGEEIRLNLKPAAEALGITKAALGRQVRQAFFGEEAQRILRGTDELKVMVRYPREQRESIGNLENMRIRTPAGDEVPFAEVAEIEFGTAYTSIRRLNGQRTVTVSADLDPAVIQPQEVVSTIQSEFIPALLARYPGVNSALEGASLEEQKLVRNLIAASFAALFLIYALIAIPLRSYAQPLIIMAVIPFGLIGAVVGHLLLGKAISMFSLFGLIALAGVVVNDSLILVDFINKARAAGAGALEAVVQSGVQRFRAILLTSLTTAFGLAPIMLERSVQAQFVIPMAISMSFGILFATVITLFLVPALYIQQIEMRRALAPKRLWHLLRGRYALIEDAQR